MSPAEKLGLPTWLPPFRWSSPWAWFFFTLLVDAGVLFVSWWAIERVWHRQYYLSNLIGDTLGLPLIAIGTAVLLKQLDHQPSAWYTNKWWFIGLIVALAAFWYPFTLGDEHVNWAQRAAPSSIWHTTLWPYFAFIMLAAAPAALSQLPRAWAALPVLLAGIAVWGFTYAHDVSQDPPPLGGGVEFSWSKLFAGQPPSRIRMDEWEASGKALPGWFHRYYLRDGTPI